MNLLNISPLDGRYQNKTKDLAPIFSEYGLIYYRLFVEIKWFIALSENKDITELPKLEQDSIKYLEDIYGEILINENSLIKHTMQCLSYLIAEDRLRIKFVFVKEEGEFHPKTYIFDDTSNQLVVSGSNNYTSRGFLKNIEHTQVSKSWGSEENQQVAAQLKIQSSPTVVAFKNKQIVDAFQGMVTEKQIVEFVEKALGEKLEEDFSEFYESIEQEIKEKNYSSAKETLLEFISNNSKDQKAISLYLSCLIELRQYQEIDEFLNSLNDDIKKNTEIETIINRLEIIKKNSKGPSIEELMKRLDKQPNNIIIVIETADKLFSLNDYNSAFKLLLEKYPKNKEKIKGKIIEFFNALGHSHESTIEYRKKLSQIIFS